MDKKIKKPSNIKKAVVKKVKKVTTKTSKNAKKVKQELNETVKFSKEAAKKEINEIVENNLNKKECVHCHKYFDKGLSICPYCRKSQKDKTGQIVITILGIVLLLCIIGSYFVNKYSGNKMNTEEYKKSCELVSYENLVRTPKNYKEENIKVIGIVKSVEGTDTSFGNDMTITINANLFEETNEQIIKVKYTDHNYNQGFLEGDIISVYGKFSLINGNIPQIDGKYIVFGK